MRWQGNRESDNLEDRRQISPQQGIALGGGTGLLLLILALIFGVDPRQLNQLITERPPNPAAGNQAPERPPTQEEEQSRKFAASILAFTEDVWSDVFDRAGERYVPPKMVLFARQVSTGCGVAPSSVGPFYCPADRTVYLDPTFFDELEDKLGGSRAEFSQAYVIAHEVGHHVQNLLGYSRIVDQKRETLPKAEFNQWSVRLELQADYLAGVWAFYGQRKFAFLERGDISSAIRSVQAIGDDRLQRHTTGFVSPEKFTHGTSAQRERWFKLGLETGQFKRMKDLFELPYDQL
jgi:predicted metalloprotease